MKVFFNILLLAACLSCFSEARAQLIIKEEIDGETVDFLSSVVFVDIFFKRFNHSDKAFASYIERGKGAKLATEDYYRLVYGTKTPKHEAMLLALFDYDYLRDAKNTKEVGAFLKQVVQQKSKLKYYGGNWFAELICEVSYKGAKQEMVFLMDKKTIGEPGKTPADETTKVSSWVLTACAAPFLKSFDADTLPYKGLTSIAHNRMFAEFMEYTEANQKSIKSISPVGHKTDNSSIAMFLIKSGDLKVLSIKKTRYHFLDVAQWGFIVNRFSREGNNSGYLIDRLIRLEAPGEKDNYRRLLLEGAF